MFGLPLSAVSSLSQRLFWSRGRVLSVLWFAVQFGTSLFFSSSHLVLVHDVQQQDPTVPRVGGRDRPNPATSGHPSATSAGIQPPAIQPISLLWSCWNCKLSWAWWRFDLPLTMIIFSISWIQPSVASRPCERPSTNTGSPIGNPSGSTVSWPKFPSCAWPIGTGADS